MEQWRIGQVEVRRVVENVLPLPSKVLVPDITEEHVEKHRDWVHPYFAEPKDGDIRLALSIHSFVVQTGDTTIVVDTCVGADPDKGLPGDTDFPERLDAAIEGGLAAVDFVVCTHLHFDHVGWNTKTVDGQVVPLFPNARYLVTAAEMAELDEDDHMGVRVPSIQPLADAGVLDMIESDHRLAPDVRLISTPGHTAGHVSVLLESEGHVGLITGDAFHTPMQFAHPELAAWRFDTDSEQSTSTRHELIARFVDTDAVVLGTHFAAPTGGRLRRHDAGHVWFEPVEP